MTSLKTILLACSALTAAVAAGPAAFAATAPAASLQRPATTARVTAQMFAQAAPVSPEEQKKREEQKKHAPPPAAKPAAPPPHPPAAKPAAPPHPPAVRPAAPPRPPAAQPPHPPAAQPPRPPAAQPPHPPTAQPPRPPAVQHQPPAAPIHPPAAQVRPAAPPPPPTAQAKPVAPPPGGATPTRAVAPPPPPPTKTQSANQFIQRNGQRPSGGLAEVRKERREIREGNRTVIQEGNRTIVRDGNRSTISHNEAARFAVGARDVKVEHRGDDIVSIVLRAAGVAIISTTDRDGHLLRRVRRDRDGREVVIIDNRFAGARPDDYFVDVPPPRYRGPRDRYIIDAGRADRARIYDILDAPPIERLDRRYTLDQVRYSEPLRQYMPRVDLDVNFDSGSWQLSPSQIDQLAEIADAINDAIAKNPREVFLIEGHTDAVGTVEDNLSLSDRRAESVAVALTEEFNVPPENLVTQGYGEEYLKVPTDGPSRENRRVAIRRITPLIDRTARR
ncbi:MAG: OmpA family protein [Rhodopseudomonas sp.]|nr:OmpA family protein [Rhodopseudomonas sp.]